MKLWVVSEGADYEGLTEPYGVYSSYELAMEAEKRLMSRKYRPDYVEITPLELDKDRVG
jgi:hypothetical protein